MKKNILLVFVLLLTLNLRAQVAFQDQAMQLGVDMTCGTTFLGNGVSFFDYNGDGWDDITLNTQDGEGLRFFKNQNGIFIEDTISINVITYQTKQTNWVDFDNDGDKDLFVTSDTDGIRLYENTGNLVLQDVTVVSGFPTINMSSYGASWGDYNNDGFLDVFVSNRTSLIGNKLYKNTGDGTFVDVSITAGIDSVGHGSFCSAFFDFNNDGFQDIYISNDKPINPNILYKNNGDGTFLDISVSSGTDVAIDAMTVTIDDFNRDGWQDIYITNGPNGNVLYKNNGNETFTDVATLSGTIYNSIGWGASFFDADNDKDLDLYVCGEYDQTQANFLNAAFYLNDNDETFSLNNSSFVGDNRASYSGAVGDLNNDGYPELIVTNSNDEDVFVWKNNTTQTNNWLKINLEGVQSNRDGIGAKIEIAINGEKQYRYTHCGEGYLAQNSGSEIFGLGASAVVDYVKVKWLSGAEDEYFNVTSNQTIKIIEGKPNLSIIDFFKNESISIFPNPVDGELIINSKDNTIDSYELYTLLGEKISSNINIDKFKISVNTSILSAGLYLVKLKVNDVIYAKQFVKK